jgi:hypothetical protein
MHKTNSEIIQGKRNNKMSNDKWLKFKEVKTKGKTKKFIVWSKCADTYIGEIKWYPQWRHYCFILDLNKIELATRLLIYSDRCGKSIFDVVKKLNEEHKNV